MARRNTIASSPSRTPEQSPRGGRDAGNRNGDANINRNGHGNGTNGRGHRSPYARVFSIPGAKAFSAAGALARLPMSMTSLGIVLALNNLYNNWTVAGTMSAVCVLAMAIATPMYARLFDRYGQSRVGWIALAAEVAVLVAFALAAMMRVPLPVLFVLAVGIGATQFAFGALVRTRWSWALRDQGDPNLLNTAYAFESAVDEVVFILGPILTAGLATSIHPVAPFFVAAAAAGIGGTWYFLQKRTEPPVAVLTPVDTTARADAARGDAARGDEAARGTAGESSASDAAAAASSASAAADTMQLARVKADPSKHSALQFPGMLMLMIMWVVFNMCFSMFDVSMTSLTKALGRASIVGVQLAMFAVGSCIGALVFGSVRLRGSHWKHMLVFMAYLTLGFIGIHLAGENLVLIGAIELVAGLGVAPIYATGNLIVKQTVSPNFLTEGLSWLSTSVNIGQSIGSTIVGVVLDHAGPNAGLALPMVACAVSIPLIALAALSARRGRR